MISRVFAFMEKYNMIEEKDVVAIGVSGGADSLGLLFLLLEYRKRVDFFPIVVHVNHGLRKEASREAGYVEEICSREKLPFYLKEVSVLQTVRERKISQEEAGRLLRYQAFEEVLDKYQGVEAHRKKIAVAHHRADQAETMLFHLFRGTGIYGMAGILPVRGRVIRPLLILEREEIEAYLNQKGISWCMDETNEEDSYTRNKIRHHILSYANKEINEKATEHVAGAAMQMAELREYVEKEVKKAVLTCCEMQKQQAAVEIPLLLSYPALIQGQVLLWIIGQLLPGRRDVGAVHIEAVRQLFTKQESKRLNLPGGLKVRKEYDKLWFYLKDKDEKTIAFKEIFLEREGNYCLDKDRILEVKLIKREDFKEVKEKKYTKYLDYDKINNRLSLRYRQTGDYIMINDREQRKKIKQYFIDEKIPSALRDEIPLIADGSHILWIVGYRISAYYKVSEKTKSIIQMTITRRERHGRKD